MDKVFEKITLYDILCYVFPGSFLIIVLFVDVYSLMPTKVSQLIKVSQDHDALLIMLMVIISHIVGTILSQICESSFLAIKLYRVQVEKKNINNECLINKLKQHITSADILQALKRSGSSYTEVSKLSTDYIYSEIQADANYSRIHGYASSEILSRNSSLVCLTGAIITGVTMVVKVILNIISKSSWKYYLCFLVLHFGITCFLIIGFYYLRQRSEDFAEKKIFYAVNWFISKYSKGNSSECCENKKAVRGQKTDNANA